MEVSTQNPCKSLGCPQDVTPESYADCTSYCLQWLFTLPLEIIAGAFTITYWNEHIAKSVFVAIFLAAIFIINLFGVKAYGEAEFVFSIIKVTAIVAFM
jgi:amino acid transporter